MFQNQALQVLEMFTWQKPYETPVISYRIDNIDKQLTLSKNWIQDTLNNPALSFAHLKEGEKEKVIIGSAMYCYKTNHPKVSDLKEQPSIWAGKSLVVLQGAYPGLTHVAAVKQRLHQGGKIHKGFSHMWGLMLAGPLTAHGVYHSIV